MAGSRFCQRNGTARLARLDTFAAGLLLICTAAILTCVIDRVALHTILVVQARGLLPAWDLASHLCQGWVDYHLISRGQIGHLLWDMWMQGYWPPVLSLYQVPFFLVLGRDITSGLWSGLIAFVLIGVIGAALLWQQRRRGAVFPASLFVALLSSSPFLLAYASLAMTETLAALGQQLVLFLYACYRQTRDTRTARLFALSLSVLFFTKYNYFLLLAAPLALHEWLERTPGWSAARRVNGIWRLGRRAVSTPSGAFVALYAVALLIILSTGGFELHLFGRRLSVRGIGNSGQLALYFLIGRLLYCHRRGRIDWARITAADPRVRPLLIWFVLPVTVWLAAPYPNHLRDFVNFVLNIEMGQQTVGSGAATYIDALGTLYFYSPGVLVFAVVAFVVAALRYRQQTAVMQVLVLAVAVQLTVIVLHHTRSPRFLLPTVVMLCLAASSEVGRWVDGYRRTRLVTGLLAPLAIVLGAVAARGVVDNARFRAVAFEPYIDSAALRSALQSIRRELHAGDRLVIIGSSNALSPALFKWELGPPSGIPCFPFEAVGSRRLDPALATRVLLLVPIQSDDERALDITSSYLVRRRAFLERVEAGEFTLRRESPLTEMDVALRLYARTSRPERLVACE